LVLLAAPVLIGQPLCLCDAQEETVTVTTIARSRKAINDLFFIWNIYALTYSIAQLLSGHKGKPLLLN
jgi:hypothetical protein